MAKKRKPLTPLQAKYSKTYGGWLLVLTLIYVMGYVCVMGIKSREVSPVITPADEVAIIDILADHGVNPLLVVADRNTDFNSQVAAIRKIQQAVLDTAPNETKIPPNQSREPADLLRLGHGQCSDRARAMDKALRYLGYQSRFVSVFAADKVAMPVLAVITNNRDKVRSHALVEVMTKKGWLLVDTIPPFVAVTKDGNAVSVTAMRDLAAKNQLPAWQENAPYPLLTRKFLPVYGLYARHGGFYPPYDAIPDVNWTELKANF